MAQAPTPFEALSKAVDRTGSQSGFARLCGVSQAAVWKWLANGKWLPAEHVLTVERETGVSRHLLRPDLYPAEPASSPGDHSSSVGTGATVAHCDRRAVLQSEKAA